MRAIVRGTVGDVLNDETDSLRAEMLWDLVPEVVYCEGSIGGVDTLKRNIENTVVNYTGVEGRTAILPCTVSNLGRHKNTVLAGKLKVAWTDQWNTVLTLNEDRIIDDDRISVSRHHDDEWNLKFEQVKYGDQGLYTCQINTTPTLYQSVMLSVVVPPRISSSDNDGTVTVREGDKATLTCNATGIPRPSVTWYRQPSVRGEPLERIGYTGEILVIHNVTRFCGGQYECLAENGVSPSVRRTTVVRVKFSPEVSLANKRMGQALGKDTILECVVTAYPQAEAAWMFGGSKLSHSDKYKVDIYTHQDDDSKLTLSLIIKDIQKDDYGAYICMASNALGMASEKMVLHEHKERTKPPPPTTTSTTTLSTTFLPHYFAKTPQPGLHHGTQNIARAPKGRAGVGLGQPEINTDYDSDKHSPQQSKSEAPFQADGRNLASVSQIYITLCILAWVHTLQLVVL